MTQDILPGGVQPIGAAQSVPPPPAKKKNRISAMAAILVIFLSIVMILFGERVIFDLNRSLNPIVVEQATSSTSSNKTTLSNTTSLGSERTFLSSTKVYYPKEESSEYRMYKMLIHAAFIIPAFLLVFVLYFWIWHKKEDNIYKIVTLGYLVFAFWMMLHLLLSVSSFVLQEYKNVGVYIVLIFLAAIFTSLAIFIQKKINRHKK